MSKCMEIIGKIIQILRFVIKLVERIFKKKEEVGIYFELKQKENG